MPDLDTYVEALFKEMYLREFERQDKINARLTLPGGVVSLLAGVEAYYIQTLPGSAWGLWETVFGSCAVALFIGIIMTSTFLMRAYHFSYAYGYISNPAEISGYIDNLKSYYTAVQEPQIEARIQTDLRKMLLAQYLDYGTRNTQNNDEKSKYLNIANICLVVSLIVLLVSLIPYYLVSQAAANVQKIEIINLPEGGDLGNVTRAASGQTESPGAESATSATDSASSKAPTPVREAPKGEPSAPKKEVTK